MTLSVDDLRSRYPQAVFNFRVEVDGVVLAFAEVSGLGVSFETSLDPAGTAASGLTGPRGFRMPRQGSAPTITLKYGRVRKASLRALYSWINPVLSDPVEQKDVIIRLQDETGHPVITWRLANAFPTKLDAPSFDHDSDDAAIESMELIGDSITIEEA